MELTKHNNALPVKLEELAKFIVFGREKLTAVRALIRAMNRLEVAAEVTQQKKAEAQDIAEALIDAETRLGELFNEMPKGSGGDRRSKDFKRDTVVPFETKEQAAEKLGFDKKYIERCQQLAENPNIVEQVKADARENDEIVNRSSALKAIKRKAREADIKHQREEIQKGVQQVTGKFNVISIDPPWPYGRKYDPDGSRAANPYPEMSIEEIKNIELPCAKDCVILLWTTHAFLPDSFDILKQWGATYKATMVWNKMKIGMGAWFRMQCEFCLVGIIGNPFWENTRFPEIIEETRREHSRKPDKFFEIIDQITAGKKLEYFSREKRLNWDNYGNEPEKFH